MQGVVDVEKMKERDVAREKNKRISVSIPQRNTNGSGTSIGTVISVSDLKKESSLQSHAEGKRAFLPSTSIWNRK